MKQPAETISLKKILIIWGLLSILLIFLGLFLCFYTQKWKPFLAVLSLNLLLYVLCLVFRRGIERHGTQIIDNSAGSIFETRFRCEKTLGLSLLIPAVIYGAFIVILMITDVESYSTHIREDGFVEYASSVFWFLAAVLVFLHTIKSNERGKENRHLLIFNIALIVFFVFCAGEEISWGQRIIGIETPEVFKEINIQKEINLHNIGSISIFSNGFFLITILFFLVIPYLSEKNGKVNRVLNYIRFPVPGRYGLLIFLVALLVWISVGLRFGTIGFHPFSFYAENYYTQMDDEIFELFAAYSFFSFSVMNAVKQVTVIHGEPAA